MKEQPWEHKTSGLETQQEGLLNKKLKGGEKKGLDRL